MKILLTADQHWSATSSMVNMRGNIYTKRLELLIKSINWAEELAVKLGCELEVFLGDFCDKKTLTDEEISALNEINWNKVDKAILVGNHESGQHDLQFSTADILKSPIGRDATATLYNQPKRCQIGNTAFYFLPYIVESERESLANIIKKLDEPFIFDPKPTKKIIFSHNDIAGIAYGGFVSKIGFSIEEIEAQHCLFLNGHLHNQQQVTKNILNVGSLTAHNFTNDSTHYRYGAWLLDTDTMQLTFYENPYSLNFYKFDILKEADLEQLSMIKSNAVLSIKYINNMQEALKVKLAELNDRIVATRLATILETVAVNETRIEDLRVNHLEKLIAFCHDTLPATEILETELAEICK